MDCLLNLHVCDHVINQLQVGGKLTVLVALQLGNGLCQVFLKSAARQGANSYKSSLLSWQESLSLVIVIDLPPKREFRTAIAAKRILP